MEELVEKAKNKDDKAFTELILHIEKDLYCIAKSRIDNENDIDDVIQETMITAFYNMKKLKENRYFKTWIIKILINNCNKFYKRKEVKSIDEKDILDKNCTIDISEIEFSDFIAFLNEDERTILLLYYYLGYTTREIADILNKREGTICSKISRAKKKIKDRYKGEFE